VYARRCVANALQVLWRQRKVVRAQIFLQRMMARNLLQPDTRDRL
jgi:hypothetical protein